MTLKYATNPKRPSSAAYRRYEVYAQATTIDEYFELAVEHKFAMPDLRYDEAHGFLLVFDQHGNLINEKPQPVPVKTKAKKTEDREFTEEDTLESESESAL